jgi:hypothetical protein
MSNLEKCWYTDNEQKEKKKKSVCTTEMDTTIKHSKSDKKKRKISDDMNTCVKIMTPPWIHNIAPLIV